MSTADVLLAGQLALGVPSLVLGTNLFTGKERAQRDGFVPHEAVFCLLSGGSPTTAYAGGGVELRRPAVQCIVRSNPSEFAAGQALARSVFSALHHNPPSGYVETQGGQSEPLYLGEDSDGRHTWSLNFEMIVET